MGGTQPGGGSQPGPSQSSGSFSSYGTMGGTQPGGGSQPGPSQSSGTFSSNGTMGGTQPGGGSQPGPSQSSGTFSSNGTMGGTQSGGGSQPGPSQSSGNFSSYGTMGGTQPGSGGQNATSVTYIAAQSGSLAGASYVGSTQQAKTVVVMSTPSTTLDTVTTQETGGSITVGPVEADGTKSINSQTGQTSYDQSLCLNLVNPLSASTSVIGLGGVSAEPQSQICLNTISTPIATQSSPTKLSFTVPPLSLSSANTLTANSTPALPLYTDISSLTLNSCLVASASGGFNTVGANACSNTNLLTGQTQNQVSTYSGNLGGLSVAPVKGILPVDVSVQGWNEQVNTTPVGNQK